jgi:REP element-mobilizing transposase RayT
MQVAMDLGKTPRRKPGRNGKRRPGGGRKAKDPARPSERHEKRERLTMHVPVHVTMRIARRVGALRKPKFYRALRAAAVVAAARGRVRIVDISIQNTHVHVICEGDDAMALARGLQGFEISAARKINRALGGKGGNVFADRYHARQLTCPTQVRNARIYVINNFRHHEDGARRLAYDPFSSALAFDGWRDLDPAAVIARFRVPDEERWPSAPARSWLLREGWRTRGLISCWKAPRS